MTGILKPRWRRFANFFSNPARVIVTNFAFLILIGTLLLMLPICNRSGIMTDFVTALFTATSATCVTGLNVVDTYLHFSSVGQCVVLILIQLGGLGLVTFATFFNVAIRKKIGLKSLYVAGESVNSDNMSGMGHLIKLIILVTFAFEVAGAAILSCVFVPEYGVSGLFRAIFLSVSAYCNAGFDIFGFQGRFSSLIHYNDNPVVMITVMALIICGGLGFIVWQDIFHYKKNKHLTLHTKIVLIGTAFLVIVGALWIMATEWNNYRTIGNMPAWQKVMNSFFQSITARTAGFCSFPNEKMYGISKLCTVVLMFIGAAPGGTGGGIKVTTAYVLIMTVICVLKGKSDTVIDKHKVDKSVVYKAMSVLFLAVLAVTVATSTIFFTSHSGGINFSEIDAIFESVSAFATTGLSTGITELSNIASRLVLVLTMFVGRVGPVGLALSLAMRPQNKNKVLPEAKIMVG